MANKLLFILLDAFRHDYFTEKLTPFMYALSDGANAKLESVLGYSETVKQSLITGTYPNTNGLWAEFILKPKSINKWISYLPLDYFPHGINTGCRHFISTLFKIDLRNIPLSLLKYFDHPTENTQIATLYDIFSEKKIRFSEYEGYRGKKLLNKITERTQKDSDVIFIKIPDLDLVGHIYGTHGHQVYKKIAKIDKLVKKIVKHFKKIWGNLFEIIIMSDHGMVQVKNYINLAEYINRKTIEKKDFSAFYDATIARFWFNRESARKRVVKALSKLKIGQILDDNELKDHGVYYSDRRYGELIFLLNPGNVIFPNFYSVLPFPPRGMHGYDPKVPGMLGLLLVPNHVLERDQVKVVDLFPTILNMLDIPFPDSCQGKPVF